MLAKTNRTLSPGMHARALHIHTHTLVPEPSERFWWKGYIPGVNGRNSNAKGINGKDADGARAHTPSCSIGDRMW